MSFPDELTAFRTYAKLYPSACILLVDTYDTLGSGVPNAIQVFKEMREAGIPLTFYGIRLDSGDLAYLSKKAKKMLNEAGFPDAVISASNDLDENSFPEHSFYILIHIIELLCVSLLGESVQKKYFFVSILLIITRGG